MPIPLYDEFANPLGEFPNYDTYDSGQRTQLANQKHADLRSFIESIVRAPAIASTTLTTSELEVGTAVTTGENWTADASNFNNPSTTNYPSTSNLPNAGWQIGPQSDRNNFQGLTLNCTTGTTSASSVTAPINISAFGSSDYISLSLPAFPATSLSLTTSFLDISSDASGNFASGQTDSIPFSASTTTLSATDCEARFPLSLLVNCNRASIVAVRFRLAATTNCTFRCLAIRCIAWTWDFAPVDQNTLYGFVGATVPPTGSVSQSHTFPTAVSPVTPADWPILLFSDGAGGPNLVDIDVGAIIQTGDNKAANTLSLYFREDNEDSFSLSHFLVTTLTWGSSSYVYTNNNLPSTTNYPSTSNLPLNPSPTPTVSTIPGFPSATNYPSGNNYPVSSITGGSTISRGNGPADAQVSIGNQAGTVYSLPLVMDPLSTFYLLVTLRGTSLRVRVYAMTPAGVVNWDPVFDSTTVVDPTFVARRRGRFGWYARFGAGDTYVSALRPRRVVYGEYRSDPLRSQTPVEGARLYVSSSPDQDLFPRSSGVRGLIGTSGTMLAPDVSHSESGQCIRVTCDGSSQIQGVMSLATLRFENFFDTEVKFDVLAPFSVDLAAYLLGPTSIPLHMPPLDTNKWTHVTIPLERLGSRYLPGSYQFVLVQNNQQANIWYLDNLSVAAETVSWQGRAQAPDPLASNDPAWVKFRDTLNDPYNGAMLERGNALQIRGQAVSQNGVLYGLKVLPKYAELGNFVWPDEAPTYGAAPSASFGLTFQITSSHTAFFAVQSISAPNGLGQYLWSFGDGGYGYGTSVSHSYVSAGTYPVTLVVIDALGLKTPITQNVTIS